MAKRGSESISGTDKAKVRVFFAEVEGNNESIQEALQTMVSAMSRPVRIIAEQRVNGKSDLVLSHGAVEEVEDLAEEAEEVPDQSREAASDIARRPRGSGRKTDRNAGLDLVPDLDFRPGGQPTLKEFIDQKSPKSDLEATLVVLYYMQNLMSLTKIGPAHVMTGFKEIGRAIPVDVKQTIRNVKSSKMWLTFSDIEEIRTTTQGNNFVEHEMATVAKS
jgi:hypothetical protein